MENIEIEKSKAFIIVEIIEYIPNSVLIKTIVKKTTGNVSAISFDSGESLTEKISPFDTFIQVIDGKAEIIIEDKSNFLDTGQSIIIPAHTKIQLGRMRGLKSYQLLLKADTKYS